MKPLVAHIVRIPKDEKLPVQYWAVDGMRVNGKRRRKFFKAKADAEVELKRAKTKLKRDGARALDISDGLRLEAVDCSELLKPLNASLTEAARFFIAHHETDRKSCTVEAAVEEYLGLQRLNRRSVRHISDLKYRLGTFKRAFGQKLVSELTVHELERWLHGLGQSPKSTNNFHIAVSSLLAFAVKRSYAAKNPCEAIDKMRNPGKPPGILTPLECERLLNAAGANILPIVALQAFCGVRSAESMRLNWSDVDLARGFVQVGAQQAKGARRRLIEMPENLKFWLQPYASRSGRLWEHSDVEFYRELRLARREAGILKWENNALRHSFCSYHLAQHQNAGKLALDMGHTSQAMIFSNYRELVTKEAAAAYWKIWPKETPANIIPLAAGVC